MRSKYFRDFVVNISAILSRLITISAIFHSELEKDANEEQIKVAYRRLAKFYHPDGLSLICSTLFSYSVVMNQL